MTAQFPCIDSKQKIRLQDQQQKAYNRKGILINDEYLFFINSVCKNCFRTQIVWLKQTAENR